VVVPGDVISVIADVFGVVLGIAPGVVLNWDAQLLPMDE
jgi:hypothetical protein